MGKDTGISRATRFSARRHGDLLLRVVAEFQARSSLPMTRADHWAAFAAAADGDVRLAAWRGASGVLWWDRYKAAAFRASPKGQRQLALGRRLEAAMRRAGVTREAAITALGCNSGRLSEYLLATAPWKPAHLAAVAALCGMTVADLDVDAEAYEVGRRMFDAAAASAPTLSAPLRSKPPAAQLPLVPGLLAAERAELERLRSLIAPMERLAAAGAGASATIVRALVERARGADALEALVATALAPPDA
jgi:hypothetical protein